MPKTNKWHWVTALVTEDKEKGHVLSLGRLCFLVTLGALVVLWVLSIRGNPVEMPPGLLEAFYALSGYVFGSKVVQSFNKRLPGPGAPEEDPGYNE